MGSRTWADDVNVAWPTAQIAVMGASGAVGFVYRKQLTEAARNGEDVEALRLELQQDYEDTLVNPYIAAERGFVDAVIPPSHPRLHRHRAASAGAQDRPDPAQEAREHPALGAEHATRGHHRSQRSAPADHRRTRARALGDPGAQGNPSDAELAAVITVLAGLGGGRASTVRRSSTYGATRWTSCVMTSPAGSGSPSWSGRICADERPMTRFVLGSASTGRLRVLRNAGSTRWSRCPGSTRTR